MKIKDILAGEVFCIEGTKSYPKLKLDVGYVDMRDEVIKREPGDFSATIVTTRELNEEFAKYGMNELETEELRKSLFTRFN